MTRNLENSNVENISAETLVLDLISKHTKSYRYVVSFRKLLFEAEIQPILLKKFGRNSLQFGTVLNGILIVNWKTKQIQVSSVKCIYMLAKAKNNKWTELALEFSAKLKKNVIRCSALTNGCFTFMEAEYRTPSVFNDVLGIMSDSTGDPKLPKRQIGRLMCTVNVESGPNGWEWRMDSLKTFERVLSLTMSADVAGDEHFGLVTREECDAKRDLRLVSSRDFPRDVRIFRSGSHCCEGIEVGHRRPHDHLECIDTCVGEVDLIGSCMAFQMKRCSGMSTVPPVHVHHPDDPPPLPLQNLQGLQALQLPQNQNPCEAQHVDSRCIRHDVIQLVVNVHGGFVEVETIAEYSGYTDHNGHPLLWSHDVEFVVDNSGIFHDQSKGIYTVKVVRFHRANVFAKWRLARRNPIIRAMQTRFHSQSAHSINLATMGVQDVSLNDEDEPQERQRLPSFSRFGNSAQSCCLPRTDSLDNVELFEALMRNESISSANTSNGFTGGSLSFSENAAETDADDDSLWMHHDSSVLKIVDDDDREQVEKEEDVDTETDTTLDGEVDESADDPFF